MTMTEINGAKFVWWRPQAEYFNYKFQKAEAGWGPKHVPSCYVMQLSRNVFSLFDFFSDEGSCWLSWRKGSYKNVHHMFWLLKIEVFFLIGRLVVNRCKETFLVFLVTLNLLKKQFGKWAACQKTDLAREERFLFLWWTVQNGRYDLCRLDRLYRNDQKISDEVRRLDCKGFKAKIVTG